jgi:hypothetical protein
MSWASSSSHTPETRGGPLPEVAAHDGRPPPATAPAHPPAELAVTVLTGDGWAKIVVRAPDDIEIVSWPVTNSAGRDLALVDALARLQLEARRWGCAIRLLGAEEDLLGLVDLVGLKEVLTGPSGCDVAGEAKCLEQLEVEEVVVADDPVT